MTDFQIEQLNLSVRTYNCLKRDNLNFLSEIMSLTEEKMYQIRGMGQKSVNELLDLQRIILSKTDDEVEQMFSNINVVENECEFNEEEILIIQRVYPQTINKEVNEVIFIDNNGVEVDDIPIDECGLSVRPTNALRWNGYDSIKKVIFEKELVIKSLRGMGKNSYNEIIEYIASNSKLYLKDDNASNSTISIYNLINDRFQIENENFSILSMSQAIKYNIQTNKEKYFADDEIYESLYNNEFINDIFNQENVICALADYIMTLLQEKHKYIDLSNIKQKIPAIFIENNIFDESVKLLNDEQRIELSEDSIRIRYLSIKEWINTLNEKNRKIISMRLSGCTLEECGTELGITRERIRQLANKAIKEKPVLKEDEYAYWFTKYFFDKESTMIVFHESEDTYYYLSMAYDHGDKSIDEMEDDKQLNRKLYLGLKEYQNRNSVLIDGEYVPCKKNEISKKLAQKYCSKSDISIEELYQKYMDLLVSCGLDNNDKVKYVSLRAFEARLADSNFILSKFGKKVRYYPIQEYDTAELVSQLQFEQYKDIEISAQKIVNEYPEVMKNYGIMDGYELHNLLKKTQNEWNENNKYNVEIAHMPFITFGNANRKKQVEELLFMVAPVTMKEYCEFYEMEYGVLASTVSTNMAPFILNYYHNGVFTINQPLLDEVEKKFMIQYLIDDFYFVEDIKNAYTKQFPNGNVEKINPRTLKELGYKVYTNYVIKNTIPSAEDYFKSLFTKNDLIDLNCLDSRLIYIQTANSTLDNLRTSYELLEYEDKKYIKFSHVKLVINDFSKEKINKYVEDAIGYFKDGEFFTIKKLLDSGFDDALHHLGFGDCFNAGLIRNSKKVQYVKTGGGVLFCKTDKQITTVDFIRYIMNDKKKMDIVSLIEYVNGEYGLKLSRSKLTTMIYNSDMYYDQIMEKVYLNKEYYYDEI